MSAIPRWDVPYDYYGEDEPECIHGDYDADILTGRAICCDCGQAWYQTKEEITAESERIRAYDQWLREQESPWSRFKEWCRWHWPNGLRYQGVIPDDDIPF